jgi:uncharacterized iron-regulated membrane protein
MMSTRAIKNWYFVHKWTSLISTLFLMMLCITGLPLIFYHEIDHALGNSVDPPEMAAATQRASLDTIVAAAAARRPSDAVQFVYRDPDEPDAWYITLGETIDAPEVSAYYTYDARTGALLHEYPLSQGFMYVLYRLHYDMYAGLGGTLFLGLMGLLLAVSLVSGVVVYKPFMAKLPFGTVRKERSARVRWLDLHNLLGIATVVWLFVVGVTDVINTLAIPIFAQWQSTELGTMMADYRGAPPVAGQTSVESALAAARAAAPGTDVSFIAFPGNPYATPHHFVAFMQGTEPLTSKLLTPVLVDAGTSEVTAQAHMPWYVTALLLSQPLHFGDYGGLPLKILWALLDVIAIVVLGSGVYLWVAKRNVPIQERLRALQQRGGALPASAAMQQEEAA